MVSTIAAPYWASHSAVLCPMLGFPFSCSLPHGWLPIPLFSAPWTATYSIVLCPMNGYLFHCSLPHEWLPIPLFSAHGWLPIPLFSAPWMATSSAVLCPMNGYLFRCSFLCPMDGYLFRCSLPHAGEGQRAPNHDTLTRPVSLLDWQVTDVFLRPQGKDRNCPGNVDTV